MMGFGTGMNNFGLGFGFIGMIFMLLFWIGFIWLIVWLILQLSKNNNFKKTKNKRKSQIKD